MIVVTGGAGFIGSHLIKHLNEGGIADIVVVDDLSNGHKFKNLKGLDFERFIDKDAFLGWLSKNTFFVDIETSEGIFSDLHITDIDTVIHLGAVSDTTCWDGKKVMADNYEFSVKMLDLFRELDTKVKFIYASSASVYGNSKDGSPDPLNLYAYSKYLFDKYVISILRNSRPLGDNVISLHGEEKREEPQIVGLRFFNVYGLNEEFKGDQASPVYKFYQQNKLNRSIKVFDVDAKRDFVHVDDVCKTIMFFLKNSSSGIFDVGTGTPRTFEEVSDLVQGPYVYNIENVPFPEHLKGHYQYFTKANLEPLRQLGFDHQFMTLEEGVEAFKKEMESKI